MPGLIGFYSDEGGQFLLNKMCKSIFHKKWYKVDKYIKNNFAGGRVHLDLLNPQPQPIFNEDKRLLIFMDGEIFGYEQEKKALKKKGHEFRINNDAEFCLHLFEEEGENFVKKLNGNFIILIFDIENQKLNIFNDIGGLRSFFYFHKKDNLIFGSEIKAILQCKSLKKQVNDNAVADFFTFRKLLGDKTFFRRVKNLPPASILTFQHGKLQIRKYWDFIFKENKNAKDENYYITKALDLLRESVNIRIKKHGKRTALALSGGLDTRLISSLIKNAGIKTFTYGCGKTHDVIVAEAVSKIIKSDHISLNLNQDSLADFIEKGVYFSEGMTNATNFSFLPLIEDVKNKFDFVVTGAGLGELFGDLRIDEKCMSLKTDDEIAKYIYNKLKSIMNEKHKQFIFSTEYCKNIKNKSIESIKSEIKKLDRKMNAFDKVHSFLMKNSVREIMLSVTRNEIEVLTAAWDKKFIDFILSLPVKLRIDRYIEYKMLVKSSSKLSKIPYNRTGIPVFLHNFLKLNGRKNILREIAKNGDSCIFSPDGIEFIDYARAIKESDRLKDFFKKILLDKKTLDRNYFNPIFIKKIFDNHIKGKGDHHRILFAILTFELLLRLFFDKKRNINKLRR